MRKTILAAIGFIAVAGYAQAATETFKGSAQRRRRGSAGHQHGYGQRGRHLRHGDQADNLHRHLFRAERRRDGGAYPLRRGGRRQCRRRRAVPQRQEPDQRHRDADRRPGRRPRSRQVLCQRPHRREQRRRNPWSAGEITPLCKRRPRGVLQRRGRPGGAGRHCPSSPCGGLMRNRSCPVSPQAGEKQPPSASSVVSRKIARITRPARLQTYCAAP